jgi:hypothetical protein
MRPARAPRKKDRAPVKRERPIRTNRGLVREPILTTKHSLALHYAYFEDDFSKGLTDPIEKSTSVTVA